MIRTEEEIERKNRIDVSVYAYAYEYDDDPLISDAEFDSLCLQIRPEIKTNSPEMDRFFRVEFSPHTGQWIRNHPQLMRIRDIVEFRRGILTPEEFTNRLKEHKK